MQVELTNLEIERLLNFLTNITVDAEGKPKKFSAVVSFKFVKIIEKLNELYKDFNSQIEKVKQDYTFKDENGDVVHPKDENGNPDTNKITITDVQAFQKEVSDFYNLVINVSLPVTLYLKDIEKESFTVMEMGTLSKLIKE